MEMGQTLYDTIVKGLDIKKEDEENLARICRHKINEISSRECRDYIAGLGPFMSSGENEDFTQNMLSFLRVLPTNVFTKNTVLSYCHRSNGKEGKVDCTQCNSWHIFSILYNVGLLGRIYKSVSEGSYKNDIKPIGNSIFTVNKSMLPDAKLYYAHPGLGNLIKQERETAMRTYTPSNFVINSSEVFVDEKQVLTLEHFCTALEGSENNNRVVLSSTGRDLKDMRQRIILSERRWI